ncbi:hypothetical protein M407DRAFT_21669 [Tulasnella calospora MUT 4182]|uniref:Uncharacterized protein n=1 Tax=Tulasnella calospora MUT 4182 TaxID=1051891 RepID=A0A0C3K512_9AGAM|nr:hypothetical protein M407DRAFT_33873 [Tulasnella calospora MUT 4182]KIO29278.1 hypothetical protein M407DRAFT_21669 [Tulasnella calospora MUT 4182]
MDHVSLPVTNVARADISGRSTSTAAPSAPIVPANPSVPHRQRGIQHPQDTLSAVQKPAPPIEPPTPSPSSHRTSGPTNGHVRSGVSFVPYRFNESAAAEKIEKMRSGASGLLDPKEVENTPQPNDVKDTAENAYKSLQEEDMMDHKAPPPYHPVID